MSYPIDREHNTALHPDPHGVPPAEIRAEDARDATFASQLLLNIFGENGRHARSAIGVAALPLNAQKEVELITDIEEPA